MPSSFAISIAQETPHAPPMPRLAAASAQPLLGIPVTLKEPFNVAGLPTTWGFPHFRDFQPPEDALVVSRLKAAGAVIIGKTNIPIGSAGFSELQ